MAVVICHTEGCANAETEIDLELDYVDEDGVSHTIDSVVCGVCSQPITDIQNARG